MNLERKRLLELVVSDKKLVQVYTEQKSLVTEVLIFIGRGVGRHVVCVPVCGCVQDGDMIRLSQSLVRLQHNAPVHVEFCCRGQTVMVVGVDVRVRTDSQPLREVVVFTQRWTCSVPNVTDHRTVRLHLPNYVAYRPSADNRYSVCVDSASIDAWMLDPVNYTETRTYRKFYDVATHRDRRVIGVTFPWERPARRLGVVNKCPSWSEWIRHQLPYKPTCPTELGLSF